MIDHTTRSREDAVSLSLSNSLYHRRRFPSLALVSSLLSSHVEKPSLSLSLHAEMSWAHQKLLGARLYAYRGNMHNPETRKAATEKEYFNCVVRVSNLTVNSQQKENC